ncbi:hypothetical protein TNCV_3134451 [Trichonephila clavipes]|nr:hypothetical protein TNCV_3134451 [Trichonephila clavipes]
MGLRSGGRACQGNNRTPCVPKKVPYADIERKQVMIGQLEASRHIYNHYNSTRRKGIHLKKQRTTVVSHSFVIRSTRIAVSPYAALSREVEVMVAVLIVHSVAKHRRVDSGRAAHMPISC